MDPSDKYIQIAQDEMQWRVYVAENVGKSSSRLDELERQNVSQFARLDLIQSGDAAICKQHTEALQHISAQVSDAALAARVAAVQAQKAVSNANGHALKTTLTTGGAAGTVSLVLLVLLWAVLKYGFGMNLPSPIAAAGG